MRALLYFRAPLCTSVPKSTVVHIDRAVSSTPLFNGVISNVFERLSKSSTIDLQGVAQPLCDCCASRYRIYSYHVSDVMGQGRRSFTG